MNFAASPRTGKDFRDATKFTFSLLIRLPIATRAIGFLKISYIHQIDYLKGTALAKFNQTASIPLTTL